ncbi:type II secretion system F family protein [Hydrogenothermus marinus]|uniref:Type II secretion system (T2SS) protein F n=1 Tax=Hydrogenothermus marinus TaxID=133270 RepID=A0A3M0B6Q1_9AQUI|nr:type II secretion system F family protein [Hydrogenothermus marinus]RMA93090.1 type II secretion system (T2SS) protein F [Hydrogenothermus marinus]
MPVYKYKALSKTGKEEKGTIEANSVSHLKNVLSKKNLILLEVEELGKSKKIKSLKDLNITFFKKQFFTDEIVFILYELGILIGKNIHITSAIEIVANQQENSLLKEKLLKAKSFQVLKEKLQEVIPQIEKGKKLADSLKEKQILPESSIQILAVGEETGQLEDMFQMIADIYKKQTEKLITRFITLLEPITLIILSVMIGFFIFATLFPIFNLSIKL